MLGKMVRLFAIGTMISASALIGTEASAAASEPAPVPWSWCPTGKFCLASELDGEGTQWSYELSELGGGAQMNSKQRNQISSVLNRTGVGASLYANANCVASSQESVPDVWVYSWLNIWIEEPTNLDFYTYDRYFATDWDDRPQSISTWGPEWPDGESCAKKLA